MVNVATNALSLQEIAAHLKVSYTTVFRWYRYGLHGVKLKTLPLGAKRISSLDAVQDFCERLAALEDGTPDVPPRDRQADMRREMKERYGI